MATNEITTLNDALDVLYDVEALIKVIDTALFEKDNEDDQIYSRTLCVARQRLGEVMQKIDVWGSTCDLIKRDKRAAKQEFEQPIH